MSWPNLESGSNYEKWEYYTQFVEADASVAADYLNQKYPGVAFRKFAIQAILPQLNQLGEQGWELIHMEPAQVGNNGDVGLWGETRTWTHSYFCVFKRRKRA